MSPLSRFAIVAGAYIYMQEFFQDLKDGKTHIIVSIRAPPTPVSNLRQSPIPGHFSPYILTSKNVDLNDWTPTVQLYVKDTGAGKSQGHIKFFPVHNPADKKTPYHAFQKNEDEKHIKHLTAEPITGSWKYVQTNDFAGWGNKEGPAVTKLPTGK